jgi:DNA repair protein RecN (Recombination protein N)
VLTEITIRNFALVDDLTLPLHQGLTVLTGETGAGKSILIDALSAAVGERVSAEMVRSGAETATVDAVFEMSDSPQAVAAAAAAGLTEGAGGDLVLTRLIGPGRSPGRVNSRPVTLGVLQSISRHLVDIHGQHEHQTLIHEENHLDFFDHFGGPQQMQLRRDYESVYDRWHQLKNEREQLLQQAREREQRLDVLRYQVDEINAAELSENEDEELLAERKRLNSVEKLTELVDSARQLLEGTGTESGVGLTAGLHLVAEQLGRLVEIDGDLAAYGAELRSAAAMVTEAEHALVQYGEGLESDPQRLEEVESRLDLIARLKRKYGDTVADVLSYGREAEAERSSLATADEQAEALAQQVDQAASELLAVGRQLSTARQQLAEKLAQAVTDSLTSLGMPAARFQVQCETRPDPAGIASVEGQPLRVTRRGLDQVAFLFSANAGEAPRPLAKVASGGELSRVMLAFKSLCTQGTEIQTIIFDEVDAGIGGQTAHKVGERLCDLARDVQVLCVTHLPQIAGLADHHVQVEKVIADGRTRVEVRELSEPQRVIELARMMGAAVEDTVARKHARQMLAEGRARRAGKTGAK